MSDKTHPNILDDDWFKNDSNPDDKKSEVQAIHYSGASIFRYLIDQRRICFGTQEFPVQAGTFCWIDGVHPPDGNYRLLGLPFRISIQEGMVTNVFKVKKFKSTKGNLIEVDIPLGKSKPVQAWKDEKQVYSGWFHRNFRHWIRIENGKVIRQFRI